ncbi:uncharacterized protein LOC143282243 [Babylonia areolata]|uniref:uncharacterized protein LOC143282243 n=1 Tax=Babylonia areolata TaxID=304850 RepID=UPI003FCF4EEE
MSGRNRGRPRGRPKGRGRGRGRACQTDDSLVTRSSRSPSARSRAEGGQHIGNTLSSFPHGIHPGAPPATFPCSLPPGVQPPGLPQSFAQISPPGISMPRASSHSKSSRHDDQSPSRVSSGMQTTLPPSQQSGFNNGRHSHESSRQLSGSKQNMESGYGRQNLDHPSGDPRYVMDHQVRPSVRKAHRQSRDFPFQEEFEPTYSGLKEKRVSMTGQRLDKDSPYSSQKQTVDKTHKEMSHRIQFQNLEPSYQKSKKDSNYFEQKHDKEQMYASRRLDRDPSYSSSRMDRDQRYTNPKHDRDPIPPAPRRGRDSPYCLQRQEASHRSSSTDSSQSAGSQYADRDTSPHYSPSPSASYHTQGVQPYMFDSRNHSGDRDSGFSKHRDYSSERYPSQNTGSFSSPAMRQSVDSFNEPTSRDIQRENPFSALTYATDSHMHPKLGCSGKAGKSNKSGNIHPSYATTASGDNIPIQRMFSYPGHPDSRLLAGSDPQTDTRMCMDSPLKKTSDQGNHGRSGSLERNFIGQSDRDKSSNRKKQTTRNQHSDVQISSYSPQSPCYLSSSDIPNDVSSASGSIRTSSSPPKFNPNRRRKNDTEANPESTEPPPLIEPMAFQQQFLKHLQEQQHQKLQEGDTQDEELQQLQREHFLQEERMRREHMKQLEKMRQNHMKEAEQVQHELSSLEQKYVEHNTKVSCIINSMSNESLQSAFSKLMEMAISSINTIHSNSRNKIPALIKCSNTPSSRSNKVPHVINIIINSRKIKMARSLQDGGNNNNSSK